MNIEKSVTCPGCDVYYHEGCSKPERAGRLENGSFKKCCGISQLNPSSPSSTPSQSADLQPLLDGLWDKINKQATKNAKSLETKIDAIKTRLAANEADIKNLLDLETKKDNIASSSPALSMEDSYAEVTERNKRANNIQIFGIAEFTPNASGGSGGSGSDLERVKSALGVLGLYYSPVIVRRLGNAKPQTTRPILAVFASQCEALRVPMGKAKLPKGILVAADLSPNQQAHLTAIRKELQRTTTLPTRTT